MANTRSISEWEKTKGKFLRDPVDDSEKTMTEKKFDELAGSPANWVGVDYEQRVKFLKDNGYELTRENLTNPELSVREDTDGQNQDRRTPVS